MASPHEWLTEFFAAHGFPAQPDGEWLQIEGRSARVQCLVHDLDGHHDRASTQLDIIFCPWPGTAICESFGGVGDTRDERIADALKAFAWNSFHVLLSAFLSAEDSDQVERQEFDNNGVRRRMVHGDVTCRGDSAIIAPTGWFDQFLRLLESNPIPPGTHWIRLYYGQQNREAMAIEVLLDNEPWDAVAEQARAIDWPKADDFFSLRVFMAVQGGLDLRRAVGVLVEAPDADDQELERLMTQAGLTVTEARRAIAVLPMAFSHEIFDTLMKLPETCEVHSPSGRYTARIADIPGYSQARHLAKETKDQGLLSQEEHLSIVFRDALAVQANDMLNAGIKPNALGASAIVVLWNEQEAFAPVLPQAAKPWWRVW